MSTVTKGKSRKRVLDALSFRQPDRLPVDLWAEPEVKEKLMRYLSCFNWNDVLDTLEVDVRTIEAVIPADIYESATIRCNIWGERWQKSYLGWKHTHGALYNAQTIEELEAHHWPSCDGAKIAFHGAIDEQKTLCVATPQQVQKEVLDAKRILGTDGGYIMCATQFLQNDISVENILAMYETSLR